MSIDKSDSVRLLAKKPERTAGEGPQQELTFERMVQRGLADSDARKTFSNAAIRDRIASWHS